MRRLLPAAGDAPARGKKSLYPLEKLGLQHGRSRSVDLVGAMRVGDDIEAPGMRGRPMPRRRSRAASPAPCGEPDHAPSGTSSAPIWMIFDGKQLDQLVEHRLENAVGLFARRVEAIVGKALHGKIAAVSRRDRAVRGSPAASHSNGRARRSRASPRCRAGRPARRSRGSPPCCSSRRTAAGPEPSSAGTFRPWPRQAPTAVSWG